jgi:Txe/YoeB family toxin of Txe-Axe toxin-antitoxin module
VRNIVFHAQGWEDFTHWAQADKKMLRRPLRLIEETALDGSTTSTDSSMA